MSILLLLLSILGQCSGSCLQRDLGLGEKLCLKQGDGRHREEEGGGGAGGGEEGGGRKVKVLLSQSKDHSQWQ